MPSPNARAIQLQTLKILRWLYEKEGPTAEELLDSAEDHWDAVIGEYTQDLVEELTLCGQEPKEKRELSWIDRKIEETEDLSCDETDRLDDLVIDAAIEKGTKRGILDNPFQWVDRIGYTREVATNLTPHETLYDLNSRHTCNVRLALQTHGIELK